MGNSQSKTKKLKQFLEKKLSFIYSSVDPLVIRTLCRKPIKAVLHNVTEITRNAQPVRGNDERMANIPDEREQVMVPSKWPHSVHGVILFKMNDTQHWGTGTLIGPNIVLTAGHNLYSQSHNTYSDLKSMMFIPGTNDGLAPFGFVGVEQYFVSPNYIKNEKKKEDYGILILKELIGERTGYFGLALLEQENLIEKTITVIGYPFDKAGANPRTYEMWKMEGRPGHIDEKKGLINYFIYASPGQSGGGVWFQEEEEKNEENYYVCAVHTKGDGAANTGTLLTRDIYQQICHWLEGMEFYFSLGEETTLDFSEWKWKIDSKCVELLLKYNLERLTSLNLKNRHFGIKGAIALAQNKSWSDLQELILSSNNIGVDGLKALAENASWVNLSVLDLSHNKIDAKGASELAKNQSWVNLSRLNLNNNKIDDEGAKELAKNQYWVDLSWLNLSNNKLGDEGAKELAKNNSWRRLTTLLLSHNKINPRGAADLLKHSWEELLILDLSGNNITVFPANRE